jgi:hypothetical protein
VVLHARELLDAHARDLAMLAEVRAHPRCVEYVRGYESHARAMAVTRSVDHRSDGEFCGLLAALLRGEG